MRIGILGAADIAYRRFLPSLLKSSCCTYAGVASRSPEKGEKFRQSYGGEVYDSYEALIADESIEAVYVPLPPALHYEWGRNVLEAGKHLLMEKPFTTNLQNTEELLTLAAEKGLTVHENYMFLYHSQLAKIRDIIDGGELGDIRLYRMAFGFPKRPGNDFRYVKALGGGALLDCGGYPVRLATELLGDSARVTQARLTQSEGYEVDLYGSAVLENNTGQCAQISFGMDNTYKCELEVWGSKGSVLADRIFTAPAGFAPKFDIFKNNVHEILTQPDDDAFLRSIARFYDLCYDRKKREEAYRMLLRQSRLVEELRRLSQHEDS